MPKLHYCAAKLGRWRAIIWVLSPIPLGRFGPRYAMLASDLVRHRETQWTDLVSNRDSRAAAAIVGRDGTLLFWGYRPDDCAGMGRGKRARAHSD
jgi:hypothetical protein